jgi:predicted nucleic acid-binding protein
MWRVVLDHAVLTSALLNPHGSPARLLDFALQGRLRLFATPRMVAAEGRALRTDALKRRHGMTDSELKRFLADLPVLLCLVPPTSRPQGKKNMAADLLSCVAQSHADFLVTSLPIDATAAEQGGTQIIEADQLVKLVGRGV